MKRALLTLSLAAVATLLAACASDPTSGYAFARLHDENITAVAVPIFENRTFDRGVGAELAEAVTKEIQRRTNWVVTSPENADRVLSAAVTKSRQSLLSVDRETGLGQQLAVIITIDFQFTDARTGKVLFARQNFSASDSFVPTREARERREVGRHGAIDRLAKSIVAELQAAW
jgi:Lipopolysaccharide-assembly